MLLAGAVVGVVAGIVGQPVTGGVHPDIDLLARAALFVPVVLYVAWWLLMPGYRVDADETPIPEGVTAPDVTDRVERIEATFDSAAVPRAGRFRIEPAGEEEQAAFRASIRRSPSTGVDRAQFGLGRHARGGEQDQAQELEPRLRGNGS